MSQIDASDFSSLKDVVERSSNEELVGPSNAQEGGAEGVLDKVFAGMSGRSTRRRRPASRRSSSTSITAPTAPTSTPCASPTGRCEIDKGRAESPRVTIRIGLADFLGLITGKANGMQLFMTGKLKVTRRPVLRADLPVLVRPAAG
jgi:hypothetical protein